MILSKPTTYAETNLEWLLQAETYIVKVCLFAFIKDTKSMIFHISISLVLLYSIVKEPF